jgi:DNA-binding NtrC family response regulator
LKEQIKKKKFRADLYYRLNVFPIHVPSLRERKEDITVLAAHFLQRFNQKMGRRIKGFTRKDIQILTNYTWPGNVRELKHIIERAVILSEGPHIILPELNENIRAGLPEDNFLTYRQMECKHILAALTKSNGRVSGKGGAAELLDLKPSTLYAKIRKFGIEKNFSSNSESSATLFKKTA